MCIRIEKEGGATVHQNRTGIIKSQCKMMKTEEELKHLKIRERSQKSI